MRDRAPDAKAPALSARKCCMERKRWSERSLPGTIIEQALWLLLVAVTLYVCLAVAPDLVTAKFYDLVWATMES